jgi:uncharacterized membrane protein
MQMSSQVGVVTGIQVMETVQVSRQHLAGVVASYHEAYVAGALVTLLAVVSALLIRPARPRTASRVLSQDSVLPSDAAVEPL